MHWRHTLVVACAICCSWHDMGLCRLCWELKRAGQPARLSRATFASCRDPACWILPGPRGQRCLLSTRYRCNSIVHAFELSPCTPVIQPHAASPRRGAIPSRYAITNTLFHCACSHITNIKTTSFKHSSFDNHSRKADLYFDLELGRVHILKPRPKSVLPPTLQIVHFMI